MCACVRACVRVCVNRTDTVDCAKLLEGSLLWALGYFIYILLAVII